MDKLIKKTNLALLVGTNSWRDQFIEAITVSAGGLPSTLQLGFSSFPRSFGLRTCKNFRNLVCWNEKRRNPLFLTDERDQMGDMLGTFGSYGM